MPDHAITHATFTLERTFPAVPERVFALWSDEAAKAGWFAADPADYELDFRPGGIERNRAMHEGKTITWESLYREIVADERIVYTSVLAEDGTVATVSLTTVEFVPEDGETRLVLVEAGAYLDGRELPAWREQGTGDWLNALGRQVEHGVSR
jgi:uncharacterized protein YndB with AHSA1/START domain